MRVGLAPESVETASVSALDRDSIALVLGLRHRIGRVCQCERCRALARTVALAREAVDMKAKRTERECRGVKMPNK